MEVLGTCRASGLARSPLAPTAVRCWRPPTTPLLEASHVILDAETGAITSRVELPLDWLVVWGRRDDMLAYVVEDAGVGNVWERRLAGGAPRRLTNFSSGRIMNLAHSPDRKRLFLSRLSHRRRLAAS